MCREIAMQYALYAGIFAVALVATLSALGFR